MPWLPTYSWFCLGYKSNLDVITDYGFHFLGDLIALPLMSKIVRATHFWAKNRSWTYCHTFKQKSKYGNMCELENNFRVSIGKQPLIHLNSDNLRLTLLMTQLMCSSNDRLRFKVTLNNFSDVTFSRYWPFILTFSVLCLSGREALFCQVVISMTFVLVALPVILFSVHQSDTLWASAASVSCNCGTVFAWAVRVESCGYVALNCIICSL